MLRNRCFALLLVWLLLAGCDGKSKEELLQEGMQFSARGNLRGAIVLFRNALEKDPNFTAARLQLADAYLESGKYRNAEKELENVLGQDPANTDISLKLATVYLHTKRPDRAIESLEKIFSPQTENVEALELLGRAYAVNGDLQTAERLFRQGIAVDPGNAPLRLGLARLFFGQGHNDQARSLLDEVLARDGRNVLAHYFLAELESSEGHVDQALQHYEQLTEIDSGDVTAHFRAGLLRLFKGELDAARQRAATIAAIDPGRAEGVRLKGLVAYVAEDYLSAAVELLNSLKIQPHINSYFFLGLSYFAQQQYELALNQFQKILDLKPDFVKARTLTALTLLKQGRVDDAIREGRKALESDPASAFAHHLLGSAYLKKGRFDEGMAALEQATLLNPKLVDAHLQKGMLRIAQGAVKLGEEDLVQALKADPDILNSRLLLVGHYLRQQNFSAAITTLNEGLTGNAVDGLLYNLLAVAYFELGKTDAALDALKKGTAVSPDYFTLNFNLAAYYTGRGDYELARREYLAVLQRNPRHSGALLSLAWLSGFLGEQEQLQHYLDRARATGAEQAYLASAGQLAKQGSAGQALQTVQEGLSLHPEAAALIELKGKLLSRAGDSDNAAAAFTELASLNPERGAALLARHYLQSGTPAQALAVADSMIAADPGAAAGYLLLAGIQVRQKEHPAALETIEKGLKLVEKKQRLEMQLGALHELAGDIDSATEIYRRVAERLPGYIPALFAQAVIDQRQGDMRRAREQYQLVLRQAPDYVPALNNMAYLMTDNFGRSQEALDMAFKAYRRQPDDPFIMDTLGYVLIANDRPKDALGVLRDAVALMPGNAAMNLHLGMAYARLGEQATARPYLEMAAEKGRTEERTRAAELLKRGT